MAKQSDIPNLQSAVTATAPIPSKPPETTAPKADAPVIAVGPSHEDLLAENKRLREQLAAQEQAKAKEVAERRAADSPGWFRGSLSTLPAFYGTIVFGKNKLDAERVFCSRLGIQYEVTRKGRVLNVGAETVTEAELEMGARPLTGEKGRITLEPMGEARPPIDSHMRQIEGGRRLLYHPAELKALGYSAEEIATVS